MFAVFRNASSHSYYRDFVSLRKWLQCISFLSFFHCTFLANIPLYIYPVDINLFKVNNRNTRKRWCGKCSKLIIMIPERRHKRCSGFFIENFQHISHLFSMFVLLTVNKQCRLDVLQYLAGITAKNRKALKLIQTLTWKWFSLRF